MLGFRLFPIAAGAALALCACSVSVSLPSLLDEDATGAIRPAAAPLALLGPALARTDASLAHVALAQAMESGEAKAVAWSNPRTGASGRFQPGTADANAPGGDCRRFLADIDTAAGSHALQGLACRTADGIWQVAAAEKRAAI